MHLFFSIVFSLSGVILSEALQCYDRADIPVCTYTALKHKGFAKILVGVLVGLAAHNISWAYTEFRRWRMQRFLAAQIHA